MSETASLQYDCYTVDLCTNGATLIFYPLFSSAVNAPLRLQFRTNCKTNDDQVNDDVLFMSSFCKQIIVVSFLLIRPMHTGRITVIEKISI